MIFSLADKSAAITAGEISNHPKPSFGRDIWSITPLCAVLPDVFEHRHCPSEDSACGLDGPLSLKLKSKLPFHEQHLLATSSSIQQRQRLSSRVSMPLMNPAESVLYPTSYYRDMALFTTQFMSHKFDQQSHCVYDKNLLVDSAAYNDLSAWERRLYHTILRTLQLAECDESLPIGTVVLLDLLKDLADSSQKLHAEGEKATAVLTLPPYPHDDYIDFFMGAFMLSYRLLSKNRFPLQAERWARVLGGKISDQRVVQLEDQFRNMLDNHINVYQPPRFTERDDHIRMVYAQKEIFNVPVNPFIPSIRYMKTKLDMYAHIRLRMKLRGQQPIIIEPVIRGRLLLNLSVAYPPCHQEMLFRHTMLDNVRASLKRLEKASHREVYLFVMGNRARTDERFDEVMFSSMGLGYNVPGLEDFERQTIGSRRVLKQAGKGRGLIEWIEA